jgi:hypothetical protein
MQVLNSSFRRLCPVSLPYDGRQHYMHAFDLSLPSVPDGFDDYLPVVRRIVEATGVNSGTAYLTVDEKIIKAGMSQRRPGPHVDGCFMPTEMRWGSGWNHYCNHVPFERMPVIVASSVPGCKVWHGSFIAQPREDGDLSHLALGEGELVPADEAFWLSPDCVHESMRFAEDTKRTFIRIAMPVGSYQA